MRLVIRFASAFTRAWVRLYTARMPADLRTERSAEIESDLWEHQQDAISGGVSAVGIAMQILIRTAHGMIDDVTWRSEALRERHRASQQRRTDMARPVSSWMGLSSVIGGILWAGIPLVVAFAVYGQRPSMVGWNLLSSSLFVVGLIGVYLQWRGRAHKALRVACVILVVAGIANFTLLLGAQLTGVNLLTLRVNLIGLLFELPLTVALFLIAFGSEGRLRAFSIAAGCVGLLLATSPSAIPIVAVGDHAVAPLGLLFRLLVGIALALIGYDAFRQSNGQREGRSSTPLAAAH